MGAARQWGLVILAGLLLVGGAAVYVVGRPPGSAAWMALLPARPWSWSLGWVGGWLPSFVHPFAFALLTAAALGPAPRPRLGPCWAWAVCDIAFEFGQHDAFKPWWVQVRAPVEGFGALTAAPVTYLLQGRFDPADLAAVVLGAAAAAVVLLRAAASGTGERA